MKRVELARGAPLVRGKGLAPGKGLARTARKPREPAVPRQEPRKTPGGTRTAPGIPKAARDAVRTRSGGMCEVGIPGVCLGPGHNVHHRLPRRMGGTRNPQIHALSNLLLVCGTGNSSGCHGAIETGRTQAVARGWLIPAGGNPATTAAYLHHRWTYLTDTGDYATELPSPSPERSPR